MGAMWEVMEEEPLGRMMGIGRQETEGDGGGMFSDEGGGDDVSFRSTIDEDAGWVAIHSANESEKGAGDVVSLDGLKVKGSLAHVLQVSGRSRGY